MKNQNTHYRKTIPALIVAMVLGCFSLPAQADNPGNDRSIVGLWRVQYAGDVVFESFDQWFPGGLEFESANLGLGVLLPGDLETKATQCGRALPRKLELRCERGLGRIHVRNANRYRQSRSQQLPGHLRLQGLRRKWKPP